MAVLASVIGAASVWLGLNGSLKWDTPAGPSIVVAAMFCFIISLLPITGFIAGHRNRTTDITPPDTEAEDR